MTSKRSLTIAIVAGVVLGLDQATKAWALAVLDDRIIDVIWTLRLRLVYNTGIAFSAGRGLGPILALVAVVIVGFLWSSRRRFGGPYAQIGLGCVIGGALGNLADRLVRNAAWGRGAVVDFIDLGWWPVFNVADAAISVGLVFVLVHLYRSERRSDGGSRLAAE
ncbi:signal peptidase II [Candidatus Poriferisodalis sp.]|uniref:signal peptidase II n=1 Tax=Candidatus Poriferisodalis sp. TaxID=3101277 RepID=UPI003B01883D